MAVSGEIDTRLPEVELGHVPVLPLAPERFDEVLDEPQEAALRRTIELGGEILAGRVAWNVNSTALGGGVAEMLRSLIAYTRGAGVDARWVVIGGTPEFFEVTKRIHNFLHGSPGDGGELGDRERQVYAATCAANAEQLAELVRPGDAVLLHDPQTAGLVAPLRAAGAHVVWRAHIGLDLPNDRAREAWRFLLPYVSEAEAYVFSRRAFAWEGLDESRLAIIPPSIDAFSAKNQALSATTVAAILRTAGILADGGEDGQPCFQHHDGTPGRVDRAAEVVRDEPLRAATPLVVQVSRWDRLKDPLGVIQGFVDHVAPRSDAHLVVAGPDVAAVADDPEGREVLGEAVAFRAALAPEARARVHLACLPMDDPDENAAMVNALQRHATVVVQKSLAEGFGLTVSEAMWKSRPVVASRVGGIQDQIADGESGLLVDPTDLGAYGDAVAGLLADPTRARRMGEEARKRVQDQFLGPRHLGQYAELFARILQPTAA